ncbi:hypothetical protein ACHHYP_15563 [Achlya hypogyna]|uniref:Uncharacterized protein n=1 Tax=Achlya hypogyna TaxID=1202772 RepID=A0A1V9YAK4_ACHHY|nr:hypothetical protein ACHHYP_15563 [Achlya hypogyna]
MADVYPIFPCLPRTDYDDSYCCFLFERGHGLRMVSFRFFEDTSATGVPLALVYFARLFQVQLDPTFEAVFLTPDTSCLVSMGPRGYHEDALGGGHITVLEFADASRPPQNHRNYIPPPPPRSLVDRWLPLRFGTTMAEVVATFGARAVRPPRDLPSIGECYRVPLVAAQAAFPLLPPGVGGADDCRFLFEKGSGLGMVSLRFFENAAALTHLSSCFQVPLNSAGEGVVFAADESCVIAIGTTIVDKRRPQASVLASAAQVCLHYWDTCSPDHPTLQSAHSTSDHFTIAMQSAESSSECGCTLTEDQWRHSAHCRWTHCRMCPWRHPQSLASDEGVDQFTKHFVCCPGRLRRASMAQWLSGKVQFGATVADIVELFPDRGPLDEKHCPVAHDVTNYMCRYLWLPLTDVAHVFPSLPIAWISPNDEVCFYFEQHAGLRKVSLRFHEAPAKVPALLGYFAWLFQVPLDATLHGAVLADDGACIVAMGADKKTKWPTSTHLELVDPRNPPRTHHTRPTCS